MAKRSKSPFSFVSGVVQDRNTVMVAAQIDQLVQAGEPDSRLMRWTRIDSKWVAFDIEWSATRVIVVTKPSILVLATGPNGRVVLRDAKGRREEEIDLSKNGPRLHGDIRDLRLIGDRIYAAGMGRQVYRREAENSWTHRDTGVLQALSTKEVKGFNSIDGIKDDNIYAVGFDGEIWHCRENIWYQVESPTNVILNKVLVVREDLVFACGQRGVLLRGHGDHWEHVDHHSTDDQLWDLEWFRDTLYLATGDSLFRLTSDDALGPVDMRLGYEATCGSLNANDGLLLSVGSKHICWTEDGSKWHDITP